MDHFCAWRHGLGGWPLPTSHNALANKAAVYYGIEPYISQAKAAM